MRFFVCVCVFLLGGKGIPNIAKNDPILRYLVYLRVVNFVSRKLVMICGWGNASHHCLLGCREKCKLSLNENWGSPDVCDCKEIKRRRSI